MLEDDFEVPVKGVIVGNGAVGKSSMIQRYCKGIFTSEYKKTIGVDFLERQISMDDIDVRLMLWDTAGQEEFDAITRTYYRGGQIAVLAFSTTDRDSFDAIPSWKTKVENEVGDITMALVQNKVDLIEEAKMSVDEVESLAKRLQLKLFRISVKEDFNVEELFQYLVTRFLESRDTTVKLVPDKASAQLDNSGTSNNINMKPEAAQAEVPQGGTAPSNPSSNSGVIKLPVASAAGETFDLRPNKQRTKGKKTKNAACVLL